jgi:hypothetical protein
MAPPGCRRHAQKQRRQAAAAPRRKKEKQRRHAARLPREARKATAAAQQKKKRRGFTSPGLTHAEASPGCRTTRESCCTCKAPASSRYAKTPRSLKHTSNSPSSPAARQGKDVCRNSFLLGCQDAACLVLPDETSLCEGQIDSSDVVSLVALCSYCLSLF